MNAAQRKHIADQLRAAVDASAMGRNEIARRSEIDKSALSRFMSGERGLSLEAIEKVAEVLNLHLVEKKRRR